MRIKVTRELGRSLKLAKELSKKTKCKGIISDIFFISGTAMNEKEIEPKYFLKSNINDLYFNKIINDYMELEKNKNIFQRRFIKKIKCNIEYYDTDEFIGKVVRLKKENYTFTEEAYNNLLYTLKLNEAESIFYPPFFLVAYSQMRNGDKTIGILLEKLKMVIDD